MSPDALAALLEEGRGVPLDPEKVANWLTAHGVVVLPQVALERDALAALLQEAMEADVHRSVASGGPRPMQFIAAYLRERGVVVLPPAMAEVLRTGEPNEAMERAALTTFWKTKKSLPNHSGMCVIKAVRAALAVLWEPTQRDP